MKNTNLETRALSVGEVKTSSDNKNLILIANTSAVDKHKTRIRPEGLDLTDYKANPVLLWNHDLSKPLANGANVRVQDFKVILEVPYDNFDMEDPEVESIVRKVKKGIIRAASIGFTFESADAYPTEDENGNMFVDIRKAKLFEVSLTTVGSNPETLILKRNSNNMENLESKLHEIVEKLDDLTSMFETLNTNLEASTAEEVAADAEKVEEREKPEEEKRNISAILEADLNNIIQEAIDKALGKI